jgi:hypothetical protein
MNEQVMNNNMTYAAKQHILLILDKDFAPLVFESKARLSTHAALAP